MTLIKEILVTYEDGSTFIVHPKLAPDVQGTGLADLQTADTTSTPVAEPVVEPAEEVVEPVAEVVEPAVEVAAAE